MERIPVFLSSDNNYAMATATTIKSCIDHTSSVVDFYVLSDSISDENQYKIRALESDKCKIEFITVDNSIFKISQTDSYVSLVTYSRLLIPNIKPDLKKVIYSDVDVLFMGDVAELYNEDLDGYIIGACKDAYYVYDKKLNNIYDRLKLDSKHNYMYAGMLLIDCNKWREENITDKLLELMKQFQGRIQQGDQDLLNICFNGNNYKELDIKYESTNGYIHFYDKLTLAQKHSVDNPVIRHYESRYKPWNSDFIFDEPMRNVKEWFDSVRTTEFLAEANNLLHSANMSFVMQGKLTQQTNECIYSIRQYFPQAEIILSTYKNINCDGLDYDKLVQIEDDVVALPYHNGKDGKIHNVNRQIATTKAGLQVVTRKYAFKLRSDFIMTGSTFLQYFDKFSKYDENYRVFCHKILCPTLFCRNPRILPFHPSDIALFGKTDDLINLFDLPYMPREEFGYWKNGENLHCRYVPEQYIWVNCLRKNGKQIDFDARQKVTKAIITETEKFFVSNFIFLSFEQFNLLAPEKFRTLEFYLKTSPHTCITHIEWQKLYQRYLDNMLVVPAKDKQRRRFNKFNRKRKIVNFIGKIITLPIIGGGIMRKVRHIIKGKLSEVLLGRILT
ncbi:MAG: hypothetical protein LBE20_05640 [Deltaproteobacteria bacterium]|jgi:lipopolysaccharide biosynthesis glycosyltransferase|nr:hypothetical protein [Deltaproteobacteria bacterium]